MTRDADFRSHIEGPLNLMKMGGKGWISIPSRVPLTDVVVVLGELAYREILDKVVVNLTPLEEEPGMWEILVSKIDLEYRPSDQVDVEVQVEDLALKPTRSSGGQGPGKPSPAAGDGGVKEEISTSDPDVDRHSRTEGP